MYKYLVLLSLSLLLGGMSCGDASKKSTSQQSKANSTPAILTGLPQEIKENLIKNCDLIDYTFYNFNFSMSQGDQTAIQSNLALLSDEVQATIPAECKPIGRKYYHINGEIVMEAELYYSPGCLFYIYKDQHTTLYGNKLSQQGVNFYNNVIQQAARARQQTPG